MAPIVMLLPLRLLITLRINLKQKFALAGLFSLGSIVIIFAFIRLFEVSRATEESKTNPTTVAEGPILLSIWSVIEAAVAVVVTNLPPFRALLGSQSRRNTKASQSGNRYRSQYSDANSKTATIGSISNRVHPGIVVGRSIEMESLHSSDDEHALRTGPQSDDHSFNFSGKPTESSRVEIRTF